MAKLKVFISSRIKDNIGNSQISYRTLRKVVHDKIKKHFRNKIEVYIFESGPPSPQIDYIKKLRDSDVYIGLFGPEYSQGTIQEFTHEACFNPYVFLINTDYEKVFSKRDSSEEKYEELEKVKERLRSIKYRYQKVYLIDMIDTSSINTLWKYIERILKEELAVKEILQMFPDTRVIDKENLVLYHPRAFWGREDFIEKCLNPSSKIALILGPSGSGKTAFMIHCLYRYLRENLNIQLLDLPENEESAAFEPNNSVVFYRDNIQRWEPEKLIRDISKVLRSPNVLKIILTLRTDKDSKKSRAMKSKLKKEFSGKMDVFDLKPDKNKNVFSEKDIKEGIIPTRRFIYRKWVDLNLNDEQVREIHRITGGIIGDIIEVVDILINEKDQISGSIQDLLQIDSSQIDSSQIDRVSRLNGFRWNRIKGKKEKDILKFLSSFRSGAPKKLLEQIKPDAVKLKSYYKIDGKKKKTVRIFPDRFRDYIYNHLSDEERNSYHRLILDSYKNYLNDLNVLESFDVFHFDELNRLQESREEDINLLKQIGVKLSKRAPNTALECLERYWEEIKNKETWDLVAVKELIDLTRMYKDLNMALSISKATLQKVSTDDSNFCSLLALNFRLVYRKNLKEAKKFYKEKKNDFLNCKESPDLKFSPFIMNELARFHRDIGYFRKAEKYALEALEAWHQFEYDDKKLKWEELARIYYSYGSILVHLGEFEEGISNLYSSIGLRKYIEDLQGMPYCYYYESLSHMARKNFANARKSWQEANEALMNLTKQKNQSDDRMKFKLEILNLWLEFLDLVKIATNRPQFLILVKNTNFQNEISKLRNKINLLKTNYIEYFQSKDGNELRLLEAVTLLMTNPHSYKSIENTTGVLKTGSKYIEKEYKLFKSYITNTPVGNINNISDGVPIFSKAALPLDFDSVSLNT